MTEFALNPNGLFLPRRKLIVPSGPMIPCPAIEELFPEFGSRLSKAIGSMLLKPLPERIGVMKMAGSLANSVSKSLLDLVFGKTAYTGPASSIYTALYASAIDDTLAGNTSGECAYVSYGRLGLTDNSTIFPAGSGTTTYTKTFPGDATKSFPTSTGTGTNNTVTYLGLLDGNAGTSSDKGIAWCSITSTTINSGDTPQLPQNAVTVTLD